MEPFKNKLSADLVRIIARLLKRELNAFDQSAFEEAVLSKLEALELKQRAQLMADEMDRVLPDDLGEKFWVIKKLLHPSSNGSIDRSSDYEGIAGWGMMPLGMIVSKHGLADFDLSFALMKEMTKRATAEFDVRPFLDADQGRALDILSLWVADPNVHVRRLVSEGTRPRLPWGMRLPKLVQDPSPTLPLLEALKDDPEEYVRRSVANHLNDIAKDHPDLVADIAEAWLQDAGPERRKLVRHACRTLVKSGHARTLAAFGLQAPEVRLNDLKIKTPTVQFGTALEFEMDLTSNAKRSQDLIIDYVVHFKKANGALAPKVFKWTKMSMGAGQQVRLARKHPIRPITTRTYYPGVQAISLRINGQDIGYQEFNLEMEPAPSTALAAA
ncbi:heat domain containing protein [Roseibium sp. TrichSKD4]|uniref:DNA alkylation repair protein n=1 Tax=Roseibium sp. TrichSKD4 TaxID=744980 RepID=UPI0001E56150|nr:DNA alkylation repair protein [Roseibium sp. TrichSKD4]EFO32874.1 heat domain containing protein [Roseibium sp. TrichSKD4]